MGLFGRQVSLISLLSVLLMLTFIVLLLSTLVGVGVGNTLRPNPFAAYEAIWPGQSIVSVAGYAQRSPEGYFDCLAQITPDESYPGLKVSILHASFDVTGNSLMSCRLSPHDDVFQLMMLTVDTGRVQELRLFSNVLNQDVLLMYWGLPDAMTRGNDKSFYLRWERSTFMAVANLDERTLMVKLVTLIAKV